MLKRDLIDSSLETQMEHMHHHHAPQILSLFGFFILGLAGSLHCVGMCGPIVSIMSSKDKHPLRFGVFYHLFRALGYMGLGLLFGFFGSEIRQAIPSQIFFGLLLVALLYFLFLGDSQLANTVGRLSQKLLKPLFKLPDSLRPICVGFLTALLPCGLLYTAATATTVLNSAWQASLAMLVFFVGTTPALVATQASTNFLQKKLPKKYRIVIYKGLALVGLIAILTMKLIHKGH